MRAVLFAGLTAGVVAAAGEVISVTAQAPKEPPKGAPKATAAAEFTRAKLLQVKVTGEFKETRLGDILKEFAAQVDMLADQPVMWTYGTGFPFAEKVTFAVKNTPLDKALDQLLTKAGGGLGYVVVSKDGDKYDGWVRLTTTGERGNEPQPATPEEEKAAADTLANAKKLLDAKKDASAKVLLELVVKKYPTAKAAAEAKELLGKMEK
jgi:hypothetical protein